jgi:hypothetical protein
VGKLTEKDIESMIADCLDVLNIPKSRGGPGFNDWERGFIESVDLQFRERSLSEKQLEKLQDIWDKI